MLFRVIALVVLLVLGIGEGSLDIKPEKFTYSAGETIRGQVWLKLSAPKKARALRVEFYGEIKENHGKHSSIRRVYQVTQTLSGERTFNPNEVITFEITVPSDIAVVQFGAGLMGTIMGMLMPKTHYFLHASLDAAMEFDINRRVELVINAPAVAPSIPGFTPPEQGKMEFKVREIK